MQQLRHLLSLWNVSEESSLSYEKFLALALTASSEMEALYLWNKTGGVVGKASYWNSLLRSTYGQHTFFWDLLLRQCRTVEFDWNTNIDGTCPLFGVDWSSLTTITHAEIPLCLDRGESQPYAYFGDGFLKECGRLPNLKNLTLFGSFGRFHTLRHVLPTVSTLHIKLTNRSRYHAYDSKFVDLTNLSIVFPNLRELAITERGWENSQGEFHRHIDYSLSEKKGIKKRGCASTSVRSTD
jgi:hypothetical protein